MRRLFATVCAVTMLAGCTTRLVDFTVISSKNIDLSRGAEFKRHTGRVTGEDMVHIIIFIPTGVPNAKEALDKAIESVPGAVALLDGVMTHEWFYIPYIYGQSKYIVEGTPLIDPRLRVSTLDSQYKFVHVGNDGEIKEIKSVTKAEFYSEAESIRS